MDLDRRDTLLTLVVGVAFLVGVALVLSQSTTLTVAGFLLVVLSAIVFVVDARDVLADWSEARES